MKSKISQRHDFEPFKIPLGEKYRLFCCDCGLVHDVVFILHEDELWMTAARNSRSTGQRRRQLKEEMKCS
jgi:hypothetical protein